MSHLVPSINYEIYCGEMGVLMNRKEKDVLRQKESISYENSHNAIHNLGPMSMFWQSFLFNAEGEARGCFWRGAKDAMCD